MVTPEQFKINIQHLIDRLPKKPEKYTTDFPLSINEALVKYANQRTVHLLQSAATAYTEKGWPLPLCVDHQNITVGLFNRLSFFAFDRKFIEPITPWRWTYAPILRSIPGRPEEFEPGVIELFDTNFKHFSEQLLDNKLLLSKKTLVREILGTYRQKYWGACICTILPLIDFVARRLLKTENLRHYMKEIIQLFKTAGLTGDNAAALVPHIRAVNLMGERLKGGDNSLEFLGSKEFHKYQLGIIGPFLYSFVHFSEIYYSHYSLEKEQVTTSINRHGILHGSLDIFSSKANAIKMLTYLHLILALEPVFQILLHQSKENTGD